MMNYLKHECTSLLWMSRRKKIVLVSIIAFVIALTMLRQRPKELEHKYFQQPPIDDHIHIAVVVKNEASCRQALTMMKSMLFHIGLFNEQACTAPPIMSRRPLNPSLKSNLIFHLIVDDEARKCLNDVSSWWSHQNWIVKFYRMEEFLVSFYLVFTLSSSGMRQNIPLFVFFDSVKLSHSPVQISMRLME
ncbi:hypothetical protein PHET_09554 [Paragonimus heterotremus]|uniref:Uncharacterized protein n=1 Tax=Paragonimus heterotremus TaxID=100268 RepID=A0A8J4STA9_9TREM|nr:hypothetical protein PHET_09554 [Paragonimus heterotremus]